MKGSWTVRFEEFQFSFPDIGDASDVYLLELLRSYALGPRTDGRKLTVEYQDWHSFPDVSIPSPAAQKGF